VDFSGFVGPTILQIVLEAIAWYQHLFSLFFAYHTFAFEGCFIASAA
jgi:hypothetical protein